MGALRDLFHTIKGFNPADKAALASLKPVLTHAQHEQLAKLIVTKKARFIEERFPVSASILPVSHVTVPVALATDSETRAFCAATTNTILATTQLERFAQLAPTAQELITSRLAPHLIGVDAIKEAIALQLAMPERFHILLLGDPGTGKTDLLRAAAELAPVSSFGLGSGSSKAGLAGTVIGKEIKPGLLAQANGGLAALDELNLLKLEDRGALYNAMEKGSISYDKGGIHQQFAADIRLLATANPTGDRWKGTTLESMRKQLPFDAALLSRFHLLFIIRKPSIEEFRAISKRALQGGERAMKPEDVAFFKAYLAHARALTVTVPAELEDSIVDAMTTIKRNEETILIEVTPRLVKGVRSLAVAHARLAHRTTVSQEDVHAAISIVERSLATGLDSVPAAPKARATPTKRKTATKKPSRTQLKRR